MIITHDQIAFMSSKRLLLFILSGILPVSAFSQGSPAPAASMPAAATKTTPESSSSSPAPAAPDAAELTKLLEDFLAGASRNDPAMHDRFWAEDLIYTRAAGLRIGKAEIMREMRAEAAAPPPDEATTYSAEDIRIHQYGTTAIVAFRLVGTTRKGEKTEVANYLNTGTFLKRNGKWQAVSWQATAMPKPAEKAP